MSPSALRARLTRLPLVAILAAGMILEIVLNRVGARLLHHDLLAPPGWMRDSVDWGGLYVYYFASVLAVFLATMGLIRFLAFPSLVPRGARGAMSALAVAFVPLAVMGVYTVLPPALGFYLRAAFTALALLVSLAGWLTVSPLRAKAGLSLLVLPVIFQLLAYLAWARAGQASDLARTLHWNGEATLLVGVVIALYCLSPRHTRWTAPALLGLGAAAGLVWAAHVDWGLANRVVLYASGLELPGGVLGQAVYGISFGAWTALVVALLLRPGAPRLRGWGVLLLGLSGYQFGQHVQPVQLAATLVGLLCILASLDELALRGGADTEAWRSLVQRIASALGAGTAMLAGDGGDEEARMRVTRGGVPVELTLGRRGGRPAILEVACGVAHAHEAAPLSLTRRGSERLGKADGALVETGDVVFDEAFRIRDSRRVEGSDPLLSDALRPELMSSIEGWLGIWPGGGARYRARDVRLLAELSGDTPAAVDRLVALVDLLLRLRSL